MMNLAALADNIRKIAREQLGAKVVEDVKVSDYVDEAGDDAYEIIVVIDKFDPEILSTDARYSIVDAVMRQLADAGDDRFPYMWFIPQDELAEALADD